VQLPKGSRFCRLSINLSDEVIEQSGSGSLPPSRIQFAREINLLKPCGIGADRAQLKIIRP
jgi:hypothetical protein